MDKLFTVEFTIEELEALAALTATFVMRHPEEYYDPGMVLVRSVGLKVVDVLIADTEARIAEKEAAYA